MGNTEDFRSGAVNLTHQKEVQVQADTYRAGVIALFKSGEATEGQWVALAECVLVAREYGHKDYRKCSKQIEDAIGFTAEQAEADRAERKREGELARARGKAA